tara:strand:+ start:2784 stop:3782 length:999 start_codon:yes stop_codon:yes gene_type:complete
MKKITFISSLTLLLGAFAYGQTQQQIRNRIEGADRPDAAKQISSSKKSSTSSSSSNPSDSGAQRPVILRESGISAYFGYDTKYFYRSNPLATDGKLKQQATGMWTNTFYAGAGLGVFDYSDSVVTPYIGGSWTSNEYVESEIDSFNYNSTGAYALLLFQYGNGWSARAGISYANDRSADNDTEDYKEFQPNLGVMKSYTINDSATAIFDATIGRHLAESFVIAGLTDGGKTASEKELSNTEYALSYTVNYSFNDILISPKYRISYKDYDKGLNDGRSDLSHDISLKAAYPITDSFKLSVFYSYSTRSSDGTTISYDYKSYDTGAGLGLNARF